MRSWFEGVKDMWSDGWITRGIMAFIAVVVVAIPFLIYFAVVQHNQWVDWCESQGGHVIDHTTHSTGISADGKSTTTTSNTTYYCLNADGGIIDIEG